MEVNVCDDHRLLVLEESRLPVDCPIHAHEYHLSEHTNMSFFFNRVSNLAYHQIWITNDCHGVTSYKRI